MITFPLKISVFKMSWHPSNLQWWPLNLLKYCYQLMDFYIFNEFWSIVVIIDFVAKMVSSQASRGPFKLASVSFCHDRFLDFWFDEIFQPHLIRFQTKTWNQPFLQLLSPWWKVALGEQSEGWVSSLLLTCQVSSFSERHRKCILFKKENHEFLLIFQSRI